MVPIFLSRTVLGLQTTMTAVNLFYIYNKSYLRTDSIFTCRKQPSRLASLAHKHYFMHNVQTRVRPTFKQNLMCLSPVVR